MAFISRGGRPLALRLLSMGCGLACLTILGASASAGTANTAASFLAVGSGSRPVALGGAYTAVSNDLFALVYNPAGLSRMRVGGIAFQHNEWGLEMRQEFITTAIPTGSGMFGIGLTYMSYGTIAVRDANGNRTGTNLTPTDLALTAGYGFGEWLPGLTSGAAVTLCNQDLDGKGVFGLSANLGGLYRWTPAGMDLGLTVYNIGTPMGGYSLPMKLGLGASGRLFKDALLLTAEGDIPLSASPLEVKAGLEWSPLSMLAVRAGYSLAPEEGANGLRGLSAGLGFQLAPFTLSYAFQPLGTLAQSHRVTLEYAFSPLAAARPRKAAAQAKPLAVPTPAPEMGLQAKDALPVQPQPGAAPRTPLTPEERKSAVRAFLQGRENYDQRQYDLAIEEFEKALSIYPEYGKARRYLSWAKRDRARLMLAGSLRPTAQRDNSAEAEKLLAQGQELEKKGKPVDAAFAYKSALWLKPDYEEAKQGLKRVQGAVHKSSASGAASGNEIPAGSTAASIIKSTAAGRAANQGEVISNLQAHKAVKAEAPAEGDESLGKAIQKHFLVGTQALDQGDFAQAQREFELILEFDPENKQALYKLKLARIKAAEQVEETKAQAKQARASGDRLGEVNALRNLVLLNPNDPAARQAFNEAKRKSKQQIEELYKKGVTAYAQGNYADAIQIWNEVLDYEPEHAKAKDSIKKAREKLELTSD